MRPGHVIFVDPKTARGGGQVVLEELLRLLDGRVKVSLAMPPAGRDAIKIPAAVGQFDRLSNVGMDIAEPTLVVANANASFPDVAARTRVLRLRGFRIRNVAIVHNYPSTAAKLFATRLSLSRFDTAILSEPGLLKLRKDALVPPWLSIRASDLVSIPARIHFSGRVKAMARPDRTKGLQILPSIFPKLQAAGLVCQVALGSPLDGNAHFVAQLRSDLQPWLMPESKTAAWIEPGDILVVPSLSGEAVCLTAQEALARGAFVVASGIGLLPDLLPPNQSIKTFPAGLVDAAVDEILWAASLNHEDFSARCIAGAREIASRAGRWYDVTVVELLRRLPAD